MSQDPPLPRLVDLPLFGALVTANRALWQMDFLNADTLATFARQRGLSFFTKDDILRFWQLGLLQADLVESKHELQELGLVERGKDEDAEYIYSDERNPTMPPEEDWEDAVTRLAPLPHDIEPLFHPFRFYVLHQFEDMFSRRRTSTKGSFPFKWCSIPDSSWFVHWATSEEFLDTVRDWNDTASFIILTEPYMYSKVFHTWKGRSRWEEFSQRIKQHKNQVSQCYQAVGVERLKQIHRNLCNTVLDLDTNQDLHTLVCLGESKLRLELKEKVGGAVFLRTMAEILRRAIEDAFALQLPEEDVGRCGAALVADNYKLHLYGSKRLLDGDRSRANEFLKNLGLNFGIRLRWYVEGKTEWGAIRHYCQRFGIAEIDVVDLHGEVTQRGQRGVAFRESLRADIRMEVYSVVSIDGDRSDNVRAVRKAAEDDEICGAFYISTPDFEFANFTEAELEEFVWEIAQENGACGDDREILHKAVQGKRKAEDFIMSAKRSLPEFLHLVTRKGESWGERLMDFALDHPFTPAHKRPIIEAIEQAIFWTRTSNLESYKSTRQHFRVDKNTGKLVERSQPTQ